jgi:hypothetical protein
MGNRVSYLILKWVFVPTGNINGRKAPVLKTALEGSEAAQASSEQGDQDECMKTFPEM